MDKIKKGQIVKATSGRDVNSFFDGFFAVLDTPAAGFAILADGASRKLRNPKKKSIKHLKFTNTVVDLSQVLSLGSDKMLRKLLTEFVSNEK
ncbi:MAG: KOW domain-containing RNA-binding protein [Ruminococcus sp.]|jgi:ribosomal protein L14E/L6E/L27E|nr:KOW domain-containing RNA-binding protein [Ruminococcus sp.]